MDRVGGGPNIFPYPVTLLSTAGKDFLPNLEKQQLTKHTDELVSSKPLFILLAKYKFPLPDQISRFVFENGVTSFTVISFLVMVQSTKVNQASSGKPNEYISI